MASWLPKVRVAACNVAPVFLDTPKTVSKTTALIREAAANRADLVVFPETFIPAFPLWAAVSAPIDNHALFARLARESIAVDGREMRALREACATNKIFAHIGFNERSPVSLGCLYNSSALIDDGGQILVHHRKLVPTFYEKLVWSPGDASGLKVADTRRCGKVGGLICGENTNPLARFALMAQGEQIHVSTCCVRGVESIAFKREHVELKGIPRPAVWPTRRSTTSSASTTHTTTTTSEGGGDGGRKQYDNVSANRTRAAAHCFEAKCFGVLCSGFMDKEMRDAIVTHAPASAATLDSLTQGASLFLDPSGAQIGESIQGAEGIVYGDLDLSQCVEGKQYHDVVGSGYQRWDVFDLRVERRRRGAEGVFGRDEAPLSVGEEGEGVGSIRPARGEGTATEDALGKR